VGGIGFEPMASSVSTKRSPPDLTAQNTRANIIQKVPGGCKD
jgi:hypothetical protein